MKDPKEWTTEDLHLNLQHAIDVEFWTIPLYLTALYSIQGLNPDDQQAYPYQAKLIESVVIQEMLHLELACNLANALGHTPRFGAPRYAAHSIPYILPGAIPKDLEGYEVKPGSLDGPRIKAFCVIELPEPKRDRHDWAKKEKYDSIGELYEALEIGVPHLWSKCFVGEKRNVRQKTSFQGYTPKYQSHIGFSQSVTSLESARAACEAIIEQGEGADAEQVPIEYQPPAQQDPTDYDPGWFDPKLSHYHKFKIVLEHQKHIPERYPLTAPAKDQTAAQQSLDELFTLLVCELTACFGEAGEMSPWFWTLMDSMQQRITGVWQTGAVPQFNLIRTDWPDLIRKA